MLVPVRRQDILGRIFRHHQYQPPNSFLVHVPRSLWLENLGDPKRRKDTRQPNFRIFLSFWRPLLASYFRWSSLIAMNGVT